MKFAAVEGGGTTWVVAIAEDSPDNFIDRAEFETNFDPTVTLQAIKAWLFERLPFDAIGIASFGPIDPKIGSSTFGFITSTPKPGWANTDVIGLLGIRDEFNGIPFKFDTDVNAPALAEFELHKSQDGSSSCAYITVGTGVGVGLIINGKPVHGLLHPEAGHVQVRVQPGDSFGGSCPFHGQCIEGMCSSGALAARNSITPAELASLPDDDPLWDTCAYYIAQLCANLVLLACPEHISIGGGVLNRSCLYPKIRRMTATILNNYIQHEKITTSKIDEYITPSHWDSHAGIVGAAYLAKVAIDEFRL